MTGTAATDKLITRGAYRARRRYDLSSPPLIGSLLVIAALGVIAGLALFGKLMSDDLVRQDRARLEDASRISASYVDRLLMRAELDMSAVLRDLPPESTPLPPETLRSLRRDVSDLLALSPLAGVAVIDDAEHVVFEVAQRHPSSGTLSLAQPLESRATLLSARLRLVAGDDGSAPLLHLAPLADNGRRAVGMLDAAMLKDALHPEGEDAHFISASYLLDREGRVLASLGADAGIEAMEAPGAPYNAAPLDEAAATFVSENSGGQRLMTTALLGDGELRVVHVGKTTGGGGIFQRAGLLTLALVAPCLLGVILLISVIQNEWRKADRRANSASDAVARAEVASDLLQAGIVDWNPADSSVVYTRGWRDIFGYSRGVVGEQVFDWISRIHPDDRQEARLRYQQLLDGDEPTIDHTIRALCADGSYIHVRERAAVRTDEAGNVARIVLVQTPFVANRSEDVAA